MNGRDPSATPRHVLLILAAIAGMFAVVLAVGRAYTRATDIAHAAPAGPMAAPGIPIAAEADVFRTALRDLAVPETAARRTGTHRRTLDMYRALRAYPGAPPRVPHGLTAEEFRNGTCNTCHERGGYATRFGAYTPVTPHPEYRNCLQCHVAEDVVVGIRASRASDDCSQCHVPGDRTPVFVANDWQPRAAPRIHQRAMRGAPPAIPHDLQLRGNCLACHAGPSAVEEIRTTHPERANCRQCHVAAEGDTPEFTRPVRSAAPRAGAGS
jgi:cytochrome c-type protein NapB